MIYCDNCGSCISEFVEHQRFYINWGKNKTITDCVNFPHKRVQTIGYDKVSRNEFESYIMIVE